ncbi:DNA polymerase III subunit beta [Paraburkholderia phenazinium]|jgi:DNA polymerase-3 subunit beta|uniref:Beta sliding clamp n=1 Tax=Paraburkholderia phenazinium TaxID=60549 RepID=A0A1G7TR88_9BURK|nr:DNA polymerase III subunit beta [Paraburkholderia phenazinium]SDG37795.1 DNA polymerase III, beta subunit [Paraburkholderia phenazinium]
MKFLTAPRDALIHPLQIVCGIVERRSTVPVLSSVLVATEGKQLQFQSTDLELELSATETIDSSESNTALTVNARKLLDVVRAMPDAQLSLSLSGSRLIIQGPGSRISLHAGRSEDFPQLKRSAKPELSFSVEAGKLKRLLHMVHFAMADNDIRYYLNGTLLIGGPELTAVATDGHRLATAHIPSQTSHDAQEMIIPRKAIIELIRLLPEDDSTVLITAASGYASFAFGKVFFTCKLISGRYPDFKRVIPSGFEAEFTLERQAFHACLQRAAVLTTEKFRSIQCSAGHGRLQISLNNPDDEESFEELDIAYDGAPVELSFNIRYLLDAMATLRTETLNFRLSASKLSALFVAPGDEAFRYVVMALRK